MFTKSKTNVRFAIFAVIAFFVSVFPLSKAEAAARCYSRAEVDAEQLLRLHSELMVITVTCRTGSMGQDLVREYTGFTQINLNSLRDAEQTMINYYKKVYGGKGVDKLDKLRTMLANEFGQEIANTSAQDFCDRKRDKVIALHRADSGTLQRAVMQISGRTYDPPCDSLTNIAAKAR